MIVSCGEALVDLVPHPVPGGGPLNVAVAAARLGAPSAFVGRVSTDAHGEAIWSYLKANGVDLRACQRGSEPTARARVEHRPKLRFHFEGENTADTMLSRADLSRLGGGPHILHGGTLGMFRGLTAETLAGLVERHRGIVSVDPNVRARLIKDRARWNHFHHRWMARAHIYRASDEDLAWIWPGRSEDSCAQELLSVGASVVFVTRGGSGATVYTDRGSCSVGGVGVQVADTVGAGDSFVAAILTSVQKMGQEQGRVRLADMGPSDWSPILRRATAAAAVTCSRPGADPPFLDELPPEETFSN